MKSKRIRLSEIIIGTAAILILFILASYLVNSHLESLKKIMDTSPLIGIFGYLFLSTLSVVIFPFASVPLVAVAVGMFGWQIAGLLSSIGWIAGSFIAFFFGRNYGKSFASRFVQVEQIERLEKLIPQRYVFFGLIALRLVLPSDVLSYTLGILTKIKLRTFAITTTIGLVPYAFFLSYAGSLPLVYEILTIFIGALLVGIIFFLVFRRKIILR